jgi:hypothetical protein
LWLPCYCKHVALMLSWRQLQFTLDQRNMQLVAR